MERRSSKQLAFSWRPLSALERTAELRMEDRTLTTLRPSHRGSSNCYINRKRGRMKGQHKSSRKSSGGYHFPGHQFTTPAAPSKFKDRKLLGSTEQLPPTEQAPIRQRTRIAGGG